MRFKNTLSCPTETANHNMTVRNAEAGQDSLMAHKDTLDLTLNIGTIGVFLCANVHIGHAIIIEHVLYINRIK